MGSSRALPADHLRISGELGRARAANHYDMAGHGAKAEQALHQAEHELHEAVEAAKAAHQATVAES